MNETKPEAPNWSNKVSCLLDSMAAGRRALAREYRFRSALSQRSRAENAGRFNCRLREAYYVTTEKGIFLLDGGRIRRVCSVPCYGLALTEEHFYIPAWFGQRSALLKGERAALDRCGVPYRFRVLYEVEVVGSNDRMHQAFAGPN